MKDEWYRVQVQYQGRYVRVQSTEVQLSASKYVLLYCTEATAHYQLPYSHTVPVVVTTYYCSA